MKIPKYFYFRVRVKGNHHGKAEIEVEDASDEDVVEIVRCKDCKHKPRIIDVFHASYGDVPVLESDKCPCVNKDDYFYSHMPDDDWFCGNGERREDATD